MIVLFGGEKGGTGKTTIATNIAALRAKAGYDVLLVDTDPQKTASYWSLIRDEKEQLPKITTIQKFDNIKKEILSLKNKFDDIIIDAGGRDSIELRTGLLVSDKVISPLRASQFDLWTLAKINHHIQDAQLINEKLTPFILINQSPSHPAVKEEKEAFSFLKEFETLNILSSFIKERIAFRKAAMNGLSVTELSPEDKKASLEISQLYEEVFNA